MKQPIDPSEILEGDLIRAEYYTRPDIPETTPGYRAVEYRASDPETPIEELDHEPEPHRLEVFSRYYLLDRPEPPFEPYWGMVIGDPQYASVRGVYMPATGGDHSPWANFEEGDGTWCTDAWAQGKLAEDWVVIDPPEGVKTKEDIEREGH